jgi:hypothetical protein
MLWAGAREGRMSPNANTTTVGARIDPVYQSHSAYKPSHSHGSSIANDRRVEGDEGQED